MRNATIADATADWRVPNHGGAPSRLQVSVLIARVRTLFFAFVLHPN